MSRILVVDDHAITREPLSRLLRIEGFDVASARDGGEALSLLGESHFDLILLDLMMPCMDGVALLAALREDRSTKDVPVIVLTSLPEGSPVDRARRLGATEILQKARFSFDELLRRIRFCLARPAHAA